MPSTKEWINKVRNEVNSAQCMDQPKRPCTTIFRVPRHIRRLDPEAYKPVIAYLGPFHRNSSMTTFKWCCVRHLLSRHRSQDRASQLLDKCLLELKKQDHKVRSCYSEEFSKLDAQDMALIMLLDGCFIIYLMLSMSPWKKREGEVVLNIEEKDKKGKEIAKEIKKEEVGKLEGEATEEDGGKKRRECMIEKIEGEVVLNIEEKDKKGKGIAKEIEEEEVEKLEDEAKATEEDGEGGEATEEDGDATEEDGEDGEATTEEDGEGGEATEEDGEDGEATTEEDGEATEEDECKKRRELMTETGKGEVVLNIEEKDKKGKGIAKEIEEGEVGKLEGEATREDEGKKQRERMIEMRQKEVVLNIYENEEQLYGPTVAGLFTIDVVVYDLLKLENQIPFFIIQLLFDHLKTCEDWTFDLVDLALELFKGIHPEESKSFKKSPGEYHHLLHLFYSSRIPSENPAESTPAQGEAAPSRPRKYHYHRLPYSTSAPTRTTASRNSKKAKVDPLRESPTSAPKWIPSATELDRAGVKFERNKQADSFLNIKFQKGKIRPTPSLSLQKLYLMFRSGWMEIPPLPIYDYTGPLFRNLIAFEQCYFDTEMYMTIYALFMDCIIDQAEDVRLLQLKGILQHGLSNDQAVADLINQLGSQIHHFPGKNYLLNQIVDVNKFYEGKWPKRLATLRRDYLGNPWAKISVLAAALLLLLTIEQAVFSALSYFHSSPTQ